MPAFVSECAIKPAIYTHFIICFLSFVDKLVERGYAKVTVQVTTLNMGKKKTFMNTSW